MEINLGEDQKKQPVNWDTETTPLLTITGRTGAGKSVLMSKIVEDAQQANMTITYMGLPYPLPSPTIMTCEYERTAQVLDILERAIAEQERRRTQPDQDYRPLLFVFDDFDLIFNQQINNNGEPEGTGQTISKLICQLIRNAAHTNMLIIFIGQRLNTHTIGRQLKNLLRSAGAHAHLSIGPITSLIDDQSHEYASILINQEQFDMPHMFGWGVFETVSGTLTQLRCPLHLKKAA